MKPVDIRDVDPQGADALALLREAFVDARQLYPELIPPDAPAPGNEPLAPGGAYVVAYVDGVPLACGALRPREAGTAEVRRMYVHRDHRRRGLGRQVLEHLVARAGPLGHRRLVLETGVRQEAAMRLYAAHGFRRIAAFGDYVDDPTSVCYERVVGPEATASGPDGAPEGVDGGSPGGTGTQGSIIRPAGLDDADAVARVLVESRRRFLSYAPLGHTDAEVRSWMRDVRIPAGGVTVCEAGGAIVGFVATSTRAGTAWIDQLYVRPGCTGRGIGARLLAQAHESVGRPVRLFAFQQNDGARRFYERHGYAAIAFSDGSRNAERCPDVLYELAVPRSVDDAPAASG